MDHLRAHGQRVGDIVGSPSVPMVSATDPMASFAITRVWGKPPAGPTPLQPPEDAWTIALQLCGTRVDLRTNGRRRQIENEVGSAILLDLSERNSALLEGPFDSIHFYFPREALREASLADDVHEPAALGLPAAEVYDRPLQALGRSLLPALASRQYANQLFLDWAAVLFFDRLRVICGIQRAKTAPARGGLSARQQRLACDLLMGHLDGDLSLTEVAHACGLSRTYFTTAFARTTGLPPHQWLVYGRVERAKQYLMTSVLPLAEIAAACGFVDQSHLTRTFAHATGMTPGRWRGVWRG